MSAETASPSTLNLKLLQTLLITKAPQPKDLLQRIPPGHAQTLIRELALTSGRLSFSPGRILSEGFIIGFL